MCVAVAACDPTSKKLSGTDCKPRKLSSVTSCTGEDHGFQECRFFFRATGMPLRSFCEALSTSQPSSSAALRRCNWSDPTTWQPVPCAAYNVHGAARCFACVDAAPEAQKTYVYAYDASCAHGLEQVTCNFDPIAAGAQLGAATL